MTRAKKAVAGVFLCIAALFLSLTVWMLLGGGAISFVIPNDADTPSAWAESFLRLNFPGGDALRSLRGRVDLLLGADTVNGVYIDGERLVELLPAPDAERTAANAQAIRAFAFRNRGRSFMLAVPTASEFLDDDTVDDETDWSQRGFIKELVSRLSGYASEVDIYADLVDAETPRLYYNSETCWTAEGAYIGYSAFAPLVGLYPQPLEKYNLEIVTHSFYGALYRRLGGAAGGADRVDVYYDPHAPDAARVTRVTDGGVLTCDSVYFRDLLGGDTPLDFFLGEDCAVTTVETTVTNGKRLLLVGDDFADVLLPYFLRNYSEVCLVKLPFLTAENADGVDTDAYDVVLFCYGVSTLSQSDEFERLSLFDRSE